ncbi:uncharacterized protein LOC125127492 [Phacochoerus africanus]|uniref:uncharacterized protein LOC125127492 n=1 Tax=Phacochoerus africanus TaxID=41426 RepID=UPI001FD9DB21|nr:uncharacterized protein LOC125127492 [Phacochoerus africanus]
MASPCGSPEDTGKLRGRDGRQRREEEDAPPEEKRLRLGLEGGSAAKEEEDAPRLGREETGTQTGGEDRGDPLSLPYSLVEGQDYTSENSALLSGAKNSPQDPVSASLAASKAEFSLWRIKGAVEDADNRHRVQRCCSEVTSRVTILGNVSWRHLMGTSEKRRVEEPWFSHSQVTSCAGERAPAWVSGAWGSVWHHVSP